MDSDPRTHCSDTSDVARVRVGPLTPNRWKAPGDELEAKITDEPWVSASVVDFFRKSVEQKLWEKASSHFAGKRLRGWAPGVGTSTTSRQAPQPAWPPRRSAVGRHSRGGRSPLRHPSGSKRGAALHQVWYQPRHTRPSLLRVPGSTSHPRSGGDPAAHTVAQQGEAARSQLGRQLAMAQRSAQSIDGETRGAQR